MIGISLIEKRNTWILKLVYYLGILACSANHDFGQNCLDMTMCDLHSRLVSFRTTLTRWSIVFFYFLIKELLLVFRLFLLLLLTSLRVLYWMLLLLNVEALAELLLFIREDFLISKCVLIIMAGREFQLVVSRLRCIAIKHQKGIVG